MMNGSGKSPSLRPLYVIGAPGFVGGADTELWHTLHIWRGHGLDVVIVPTWGMSAEWKTRCEGIGCAVYTPRGPEELLDVPGLAGATVVSFCNGEFLKHVGRLRRAGCRTIWANCMTWAFDAEHVHFREFGPFDHFVFQSHHQRAMLEPHFRQYGYRDEQGSVIRGAFALGEFPFQPLPHAPKEVFVVGRIRRADPDKYSSNTWPIYQRIPYPIHARLMAWSEHIERKLGPTRRGANACPPTPSQRSASSASCTACSRSMAAQGRIGRVRVWKPWPAECRWWYKINGDDGKW